MQASVAAHAIRTAFTKARPATVPHATASLPSTAACLDPIVHNAIAHPTGRALTPGLTQITKIMEASVMKEPPVVIATPRIWEVLPV
jgi:hypothetical protein